MQPAPLYSDVAEPLSGGAAYWLKALDGVRIRAGVWAEGTRGTVLMFPGRTEYVEKYVHVAAAMRARGYATIIIDWRGQGLADRALSDPMSGHVGSFAEYQLDVTAALAAVSRLGLPEPLFLLSHSMGGCIGLRALQHGLQVRAAVFSGPMWGIRIRPALRPVAWVVGKAARRIGLAHRYAPSTGRASYVEIAPFQDNLLTTDPDMYALMQRQIALHPDLTIGGPSIGWLIAALEETRALRAMASPRLPCLTAIGSNERIIDVDAVLDRMARWPGGRVERFAGAEHEVIMESPGHLQRFFGATADLFDRHAKA